MPVLSTMRALVYADLQATEGNEKCFLQPEKALQAYRVEKFYADLKRVYDEYSCDCLFDLGDTTDDRTDIPIPTIEAVMAGLSQFPDNPWNTKLIGNHEQFLRNCTVHVGRLFERKFTVVDTTAVYTDIPGIALICAAYPASDESLTEWLRSVLTTDYGAPRVLLGHFQAIGSSMASGVSDTGIPKNVLKRFDLALLGHVHRPQTVIGNAHYVGSPFQQNYGEKQEAKRVGVLDLKTLEIQWVPLPGYPEYRVRSYSEWLAEMQETEEHRYQVRITNQEEAEAFYAHPLADRVTPIFDYATQSEVAEEAKDTSEDRTLPELMRQYVAACPAEAVGLTVTSQELLDIGNLILET